MPIILPATLATAAACALLNIWLSVRVGQVRGSEKVSVGDGGNLKVIARMRAHANFVENAPFVLILLALIELAKGTQPWLWAYAAVFVLARIAHGLGMDTWRPGRMIGTLLTMILLLILAVEGGLAAYGAANPPAGIAIETVPAA
jgi:hypothetical protein